MQPEEWGWCRCAGIPSGEVFCLHSKYIVYKSKPEDGAGVRGAHQTPAARSWHQIWSDLASFWLPAGQFDRSALFNQICKQHTDCPNLARYGIWLVGVNLTVQTATKYFRRMGQISKKIGQVCSFWSVFYRTQVSLGSDLWVRMSVRPSVRHWHTFVKHNWVDSGWWGYQLNTNW